eukprot:GGOE01053307.1.p3 GENE.GGOE01053307.1~~GGOE01053307.1.p3  ORF type:complete len:112 (+),score=14.10 GGOE01053307.1:354-689(+)
MCLHNTSINCCFKNVNWSHVVRHLVLRDEGVRQQLTAAGADQTTPTEPASSQCPAAASPVKGPASDTHGTTSHSEGKQSTQKKEVRRPNDKHAKRQALVEEVRDGLSVAQK